MWFAQEQVFEVRVLSFSKVGGSSGNRFSAGCGNVGVAAQALL